MRLNRRNVLFVLGTTILLGGMLIASGAFSQVEADRTVAVNTTGDANAALGLAINDNANHYNVTDANGGNGVVKLHFDNANDNAKIYYDDVLNVSNNDNEQITVTAYSNHSAVEVYNATDGRPSTFGSDNLADLETLSKTDTKTLGIALNTSDTSLDSGEPTITIEAERTQ
ncbi:DUF1102 domain-containing protein [Natrinema sp. 1APR25-10V2]|uniref:DUF1102 domain-containing protein n=1 Tax=Natrinema sp. 1APR25-10V2 TaxID=2951081 RepID=UPI002876852C|nr:DUF1102 domain-containing protein [Natrinema sp. 1APR25-10V2]MDS0476700.1 DUF1102 domain-containing protein [Natrinema sp. 1APR25-10V2]